MYDRAEVLAENLYRIFIRGVEPLCPDPYIVVANLVEALKVLKGDGLPQEVCNLREQVIFFAKSLSQKRPDLILEPEIREKLKLLFSEIPINRGYLQCLSGMSNDIIALAPPIPDIPANAPVIF